MRLVVTRPQAQATATAARLRERGHEVIILPLTEIVALPAPAIDLPQVECVAATSTNALHHANPKLLRRISHLPLFAVGDRTADEGGRAGFAKVESASGDVDALAKLVLKRTMPDAIVAYLCGRTRRRDFEAALQYSGRKVLAVETYATRVIAPGANGAAALNNADAVLVYAQSAARALNEIGVSALSAKFICMSARVAEALQGRVANVVVANHPDEASMFAEIDRLP